LASNPLEKRSWTVRGKRRTYYIAAGLVLGLIGGGASLLLNIVGSVIAGQHPLQLIRVYLTFPAGDKALELTGGPALAAGCCLYLATGMLLGIPFYYVLSRYSGRAPILVRFVLGTVLALCLWLINYYGLLYWLQPALFHGGWIVERIPIPVAVATHVVFGWAIVTADLWCKATARQHAAHPQPSLA
jgi:hypothetical protein